MNRNVLTVGAVCLLALTACALNGCEKGKPRHLPPDPMAIPPPPPAAPVPTAAASVGTRPSLSVGLPSADYGAGRDDVAAYFRSSGLTKVGFKMTLPAGALAIGPHHALVRVVAADGKAYYDGAAIGFEVK